MNEANHNANSFDPDFWFDDQSESPSTANAAAQPDSTPESSAAKDSEPLTAKMDWQRVAHKLREYNRKLLKKVFRLEQDLAEIDNKFNKQVEKSASTDLLLARQADELKASQAKNALLIEKLAHAQQQIEDRELVVKQVSEQYELSQQQTAQLERECTLVQEKYNQKAFELVAKEREIQELQSELDRQQHSALQQEAELKRYQEAAERKEKAVHRNQNYPHNRFIQPWSTAPRGLASTSTSGFPEPKIALPKTKIKNNRAKQVPITSTEIQTAAEIATWSASTEARKKVKKSQSASTQTAKTKQSQKPQSLAAVDLPTFPRPK